MIVLDASALVQLLLLLPGSAEVEERIAAPEVSIHAPDLAAVEVLQAVRRHERQGDISPERAALAVRTLLDLDLDLHPHEGLLERAWVLRSNLSIYAAAYVALAEALAAPLLTFDAGLARSPGHVARIELLAAA